MKQTEEILDRLDKLEARNKRVEADKAWETSWVRRLIIMCLTYLTVVCYLSIVVHIDPWINAVVPVAGYFVSTLTVSLVKNRWVGNRSR